MLTKFRNWIYLFITERLLDDDYFVSRLFSRLEKEKQNREELKEAVRKAKIDAEQRVRAEEIVALKKKQQDACSHLKGGRGLRSPYVDYNIWIHTFPGEVGTTVRCLTCSKEWKGEQLKSEEVQRMMERTTNTPSSSEVTFGKTPDRDPKAVFYNKPWPEEKEPTRDLEIAKESIMDNIVRRMKQIRKYNKIRQGL